MRGSKYWIVEDEDPSGWAPRLAGLGWGFGSSQLLMTDLATWVDLFSESSKKKNVYE